MPSPDALLLSVDSLVAGLAVAPLLRRAFYRVAGAVLVGVADGAASFVGMWMAVAPQALLVVAPALPALYGAYLIAVSALAKRRLAAMDEAGPPARCASGHLPTLVALSGLALALSLDNLVAAAATHQASFVAMGCVSAALMLLGLAVGARIVALLSDTQRVGWVGVGLLTTACAAALG